MKYVRLLLSIIIGMVVVTLIVEGIEFFLVSSISGKDLEYLESNQDVYFETRNTPSILAAKLVYTLVAAGISGYLVSLIAGSLARIGVLLLITIQTAALIWGGFFSEWSSTAPIWLWLALIVVTGAGFYLGYHIRQRSARRKLEGEQE